ncbi:MAG: YwmB family TATA-box binding protein [Bacillota bacterium]|nr:YwmB family TATA-box binding protein [Bacillota bacterium]MDW7684391.1 YwmB family TATA-box binding protein [Bacillota bacterium]
MKHTKKIVLLLCLVAILVTVYRLPRREMAGTEALEALLLTTGAEIVEGEVQYYAVLNEEYQTMSELEAILLNVADLLGLDGGEVQHSSGETFRVLDVTGQTTLGTDTHIVVQSNPGGPDAGMGPQTYLLVVCRDSSITNIESAVQGLSELLKPSAPEGQLSYYLTGELPGRRSPEEMENLAQTALSAVRGRVIEGMWEEDIISLTAYTPLIDRHMSVDGEKFNLNIAVRYDDYHDKTVLWAGFPLIHGSY